MFSEHLYQCCRQVTVCDLHSSIYIPLVGNWSKRGLCWCQIHRRQKGSVPDAHGVLIFHMLGITQPHLHVCTLSTICRWQGQYLVLFVN